MRKFLAATAIAILANFATAMAQDAVILNSTENSIRPGIMIPYGTEITIAQTRELTILLSDGTTIEVVGPYSGPVEQARTNTATKFLRGAETKVLGAVRAPAWDKE